MKIGIIFDLDGTLLDTLGDLTDSVNETMRHFGCPERTIRQVRAIVGNGAKNLIKNAMPAGSSEAAVEEALAYYREYYQTHSQIKTAPYPGILEALAQIQKKFPVAIVSNKPDADTTALAAVFFPGVYARGEHSDCPRKPAPDMLFEAMTALNVEKCIYVGDSEVDILTAGNTNAPCLSVLWGFRDRDVLEKAGGKLFCDSPEQMPQMLEMLARKMSEEAL